MTERFKVFVCQPRYGAPSADARDAYWFCSDGTLCEVIRWHSPVTSATANCMNMSLADALDMRDEGKVTHFAMIHSDVCPEPGFRWLDELADEMHRYFLDMVSAVVPIKDHVGDPRTSTAFGDAGDPAAVTRAIHLSDRERMAETIVASHACEPGEVMLLNTGLMLADLRHPAWDSFPGFDISTWIERGEDGKRRARMRSEDWELSRHLQAHGANVGATWRVPLYHEGQGRWHNGPQQPS